jgi:hypothetical protein
LSLYSRGYDLRRVDLDAARVQAPAMLAPALAPVAPLAPRDVPAFRTNAVSAAEAFGFGPRLFRWLPQPALDADGLAGGMTLSSIDLVGRSELTATGAFGTAASWQGSSLAAIWRGKPSLAIRIEPFVAGQRLSDSRSPILHSLDIGDSATRRLDTRLAGGMVSLDGTYAFETWSARFRLGGSAAQLRDALPDTVARVGARMIGFADAGVSFVQRGDGISVSESLGSNFTGGRTFNESFARGTATLGLGVTGPRILFPVSATASYGRMTDDAPLFEQFALGGGPALILDRLLLSQRWSMPALPAEVAVGSSAAAYRVNVTASPLVWYWWAGSTSTESNSFSRWHNVVGVEWSQSVATIVPAGTPAARAQIGVGESLDAPLRRQFRAYASLVINP